MNTEKKLKVGLKLNKAKIADLDNGSKLRRGFLSIGRKCSIANNCKRLRRRKLRCPKW